MRNLLMLLLALWANVAFCAEGTAPSTPTTNTVAFYFGAHPDDWQLFMNPNAWYDVQKPSNKVVFVWHYGWRAKPRAAVLSELHSSLCQAQS